MSEAWDDEGFGTESEWPGEEDAGDELEAEDDELASLEPEDEAGWGDEDGGEQ